MQLSKHHHKNEFSCSMSGQDLKTVEQHPSLGVIIDHQLSWKPHVDYVRGKAMKQIEFLNRNLHACSKTLKKLSYKQFVSQCAANLRLHFICLGLYHQGDVNKLEMIQHRAAHFVLNQPWRRNVRDSVTLLLESLNWPTLQTCRECTRLLLLYKLINQFLQIPANYLPT